MPAIIAAKILFRSRTFSTPTPDYNSLLGVTLMTWPRFAGLLKSCQQTFSSRPSDPLKPKSGLVRPPSPSPDLRSKKLLILNDWGYTDPTLVTGVPIPNGLKMSAKRGTSV